MLVGIYFDPREEDEAASLLEELHELVETLGINIVHSVFYRSREMHKQYLCGTGKAQEIVDLARAYECDVIIFDNGLAPSQQRSWEKLGDIAVIDREEVILDIFKKFIFCHGIHVYQFTIPTKLYDHNVIFVQLNLVSSQKR